MMHRRKIFRAIASILVFFIILPPSAETGAAFAAWFTPPIEAPGKDDVGADDADNAKGRLRKANVLFFLDTGNGMLFSPKGRLPLAVLRTELRPIPNTWPRQYEIVPNSDGTVADWQDTNNLYNYLPGSPTNNEVRDYVINMMQYNTFGNGTVPPVNSSANNALRDNDHYGRDIDDANNFVRTGSVSGDIEMNRDNYYFPYSEQARVAANDISHTFRYQSSLKGTVPDSYSSPGSYYTKDYDRGFNFKSAVPDNKSALPYMMVFKDPKHWKGWTGSTSPTQSDLAPNDSRIYQMKLVMWRLLEDRMLFENIRFGMASAFSMMSNWGSTWMIPYKVYPYGYRSGTDPISLYTHGILGTTNDGVPSKYQVYDSVDSTWGIPAAAFEPTATQMERNFANRGYLKVPIAEYDKVWEKGTMKMSQLDKFRLWIDGVEDMAEEEDRPNQFYKHRNPELKTSGYTPLAKAIFQDPGSDKTNRTWYLDNGAVKYSLKDSDSAYNAVTSWNKNTHDFTAGSGEAVGSVIDFFSPYYPDNSATPPNSFKNYIDEQFPIRDACDPNWLIVFTAGDDSKDYSPVDAVEDLYKHTASNDVTIMKYENNKRTFQKGRLDKPIRTMVVGFVDPDDDSDHATTLKNTLNQMARVGQGLDRNDESVSAYFANNVPALLSALQEIMGIINNDIQPAKEAMLEGDTLNGDDLAGLDLNAEKLNLYAASYRINQFDQWEGALTKYITAKNRSTGAMETKKGGELGDKIRRRRDASPSNPRRLVFWNGGSGNNFKEVGFTGRRGTGYTTRHDLADFVGLGNEITQMMDTTPLGKNGTYSGKTHISRAMFDWYYGYDVSYIDDKYYPRRFMLADQGRSGIVKVGAPAVVDSLEGFPEFAESRSGDPIRLYVQTNDGVLHVVNPKNDADGGGMSEELAILPPPTLLPRRMFKLKASLQSNGMYKWVDVKDYNANTSDDIPISSVPAYILDGPLQLRYFDIRANAASTSPNWRGLLFGSLGRGGSGLYAMDVINPADPQFYWYRETIEEILSGGGDGPLTLVWRASNTSPPQGSAHPATPYTAPIPESGGPRDDNYWNDVYQNPQKHAYEQLGFNSPKPYFSVAELKSSSGEPAYRNLIALGGGMQNKPISEINRNGNMISIPDENGKMGAALYLIDPDARFHGDRNPDGGVRVYNGGSLESVPAEWRVGSERWGDDPYMGMVNSEPVFLATRYNNYVARGSFFADNRGSVFYISFEDPETGTPYESWDQWKIYAVASLRGAGDAATDSYSIPWGLMGGSRGGSSKLWVGGGTADALLANPPDRDRQNLPNKSQMIFAFVMPDLVEGEKSLRSGWTEINAEVGGAKVAANGKGWYIPLQKGNEGDKDEYVTTRPVLFGGNMYIATFMERKIDTKPGMCATDKLNGSSRLYAISLETGESVLWNDGNTKYLQFDGIRITSFTISEKGSDTLVAAYQVLDQKSANSDISEHVSKEELLSKVGDLDALVIKMLEGGGGGSGITSNDSMVNYWRYY
ncbi:MAG: hypothetical protein LBS53_13165 [Synergistaceae bacterium]|jgi:hypothetical protein|nr:hypothetical protein [Synergistaceae bacterium]